MPDLRNTRVIDIIHELEDYGVQVAAHDPMADSGEARRYYGLDLVPLDRLQGADAVVVAVMHRAYMEMGLDGIKALCTNGTPIVVDVKGAFAPNQANQHDITYWRL